MKHITKEQWNELSNEHKKVLFSSVYKSKHLWDSIISKGKKPKLKLSTGQMIQFLGENLKMIDTTSDEYAKDYLITYNEDIEKISIILKSWKYAVPALWEAVKYKLNK